MKKTTFILLLVHLISYLNSQAPISIATNHTGGINGGQIAVAINGQSNTDFCYQWHGPNGYFFGSGNQSNLDFGTYCVTVSDCNGVIMGDPCSDGSDYTYITCVDIVGSTCPGFNPDMSFTPPSSVCAYEDDITVFAPAFLPSCMSSPKYSWKDNNIPIGGNSPSVEDLTPGSYCVHITETDFVDGCPQCEGYFCIDIPALDEEGLDMEIEVEQPYYCIIEVFPWPLQWWIFNQGEICFSIENFDPNINYTGHVTHGFVNNSFPSVTTPTNPIPGSVTPITPSATSIPFNIWTRPILPQITNKGNGDFCIDTGTLNFGDQFCIEFHDECNNIFKECIQLRPRSKSKKCHEGFHPGGHDELEQLLSDERVVQSILNRMDLNDIDGTKGVWEVANWTLRNDIGDKPHEDLPDYVFYEDESSIHYWVNKGEITKRSRSATQLNSGILGEMNVAPNPASHNLKIELISEHKKESNLRLYGVQGNIILDKKIQLTKGNNLIELSVEDVEDGTYLISIPSYSIEKVVIIK